LDKSSSNTYTCPRNSDPRQAVGTYDSNPTPNATYLIDAANGKILRKLVIGADFAQSVFADNALFIANQYGVYAWASANRA